MHIIPPSAKQETVESKHSHLLMVPNAFRGDIDPYTRSAWSDAHSLAIEPLLFAICSLRDHAFGTVNSFCAGRSNQLRDPRTRSHSGGVQRSGFHAKASIRPRFRRSQLRQGRNSLKTGFLRQLPIEKHVQRGSGFRDETRETEPDSAECSFELRRIVDENGVVFDLLFLAEPSKERHDESSRSCLKQLRVEGSSSLEGGNGVQPVG